MKYLPRQFNSIHHGRSSLYGTVPIIIHDTAHLNISKYAKTITLKIELETNETKVQSF
jgi:hypothetical protein